MKNFISGFLTAMLLLIAATVNAATETTIPVVFNASRIIVDGLNVNADNITYNGTTYVPLRAISKLLNKDVDYDAETKTIYIGDIITSETYNDNPIPLGIPYIIDNLKFEVEEVSYKDLAKELLSEMEVPVEESKDYVLMKVKVKNLSDENIEISEDIFTPDEKSKLINISEPQPSFRTTLIGNSEYTNYIAIETSNENPIIKIRGKEFLLS